MTSRKRAPARKPAPKTAKVPKGSRGEKIYQAVRGRILSLKLLPGSSLDEGKLSKELGFSRTPFREALVRLAGEGLIELLPNRGAQVAPMSWNDIRENLEALDISQRLVTRWAAVRRTPESLDTMRRECEAFERAAKQNSSEEMIWSNWRFHAAIAEACGNSAIERFYKYNLTLNLRITRLAMTREHFSQETAYSSHIGNILREHRQILAAIERKDADAAERLAQSHVDLARQTVIETLVQSITPSMNLNLSESAERG